MMLDAMWGQRLRIQVIGLGPFDVAGRDTRRNQPIITRAILVFASKLGSGKGIGTVLGIEQRKAGLRSSIFGGRVVRPNGRP